MIDHYNSFDAQEGKKIDMRGIMVGNGVMAYDSVEYNQV